jgi:flagellar biosynthesis/type III secretory pathway chaperone
MDPIAHQHKQPLSTRQQAQLQRLLSQEAACLEQLLEILEHEHSALLDTALEDIVQSSNSKQRIVQALEQCIDARTGYLSRLRHTEESADQQVSLQTLASQGDGNVIDLVGQLDHLTRRCKELNISNGMLILKKEKLTRRALDVLRPGTATTTYSDKGTTRTRDSRSLGKA